MRGAQHSGALCHLPMTDSTTMGPTNPQDPKLWCSEGEQPSKRSCRCFSVPTLRCPMGAMAAEAAGMAAG